MDEQLKQQILQKIGPAVIGRMVMQVLNRVDSKDLTPDHLRPIIAALEEVLHNPEIYPQTKASLEQAGVVKPGDLPEEFEPTIVTLLLLVLNEVAKALQQRGLSQPVNFARGGLNDLARRVQEHGRRGDTMLAHINPAEAAALRKMGGAGTINPATGLPEFGFFSSIVSAVSDVFSGAVDAVKDVVSSLGPAAPIIAAVVAPYAIPALAGSIGISSLAAGALYGAGTSALTGGNIVQGALMGGLSGGLGDMVGSAANNMLGTSLGQTGQTLLGNALVGGAAGAATGAGFMKGALTGAAGTMLGNTIGDLAGQGAGTALGQGLSSAGKTIGQMSAAGFPLKQALMGGALSGLVSGGLSKFASPGDQFKNVSSDIDSQLSRVESLLNDPSVPETAKEAYRNYAQQLEAGRNTLGVQQAAFGEAPAGSADATRLTDLVSKPGTGAYSDTRAIYQDLGIAPTAPTSLIGDTGIGFNKPTMIAAGAVALPFALESIAGMQTPQQIQQAVQTSNPEYFKNLRLNSWNWGDIQQKAAAAGEPLGIYVAKNWNTLTDSVRYTSPGGTTPVAKARGGALGRIANLAQGAGTGRSDEIDARLSDGEYVMDAETVAMLGDGSTRAGASKLDKMRQELRRHKGKALSKGKFSPDAKSPLAYLKGAV